jgi:hypothetical protein
MYLSKGMAGSYERLAESLAIWKVRNITNSMSWHAPNFSPPLSRSFRQEFGIRLIDSARTRCAQSVSVLESSRFSLCCGPATRQPPYASYGQLHPLLAVPSFGTTSQRQTAPQTVASAT